MEKMNTSDKVMSVGIEAKIAKIQKPVEVKAIKSPDMGKRGGNPRLNN